MEQAPGDLCYSLVAAEVVLEHAYTVAGLTVLLLSEGRSGRRDCVEAYILARKSIRLAKCCDG